MKKTNLGFLAIACGSFLTAFPLRANLVQDPGFESQVQPTSAADPTTSPWTRNAVSAITLTTSSYWVHSGIEGLAFEPGSDDLLTQNLATQAGQDYSISFWLRDGGTPNVFSLLWNGSTIATLGPPVLTVNGNWEQFTYYATATGTSTVLGFEVTPGESTYTPALDDVDVEAFTPLGGPVPEPATIFAGVLLMLPLGLSTLRRLFAKRVCGSNTA